MTTRTGVELIAAERRRQVEKLGYDAAHDDEHDNSSLALVATLYATPDLVYVKEEFAGGVQFIDPWPSDWDGQYDQRPHDGNVVKPNSGLPVAKRIKQLAKAGALIAAEIDRLQRVTP